MALITRDQVEGVIGAAQVAELTRHDPGGEGAATGDPAVITLILGQVDDWLQEYATEAGTKLTTESMTASLVRRGAIAFGHMAGLRRPDLFDKNGDPPYARAFAGVERSMDAWTAKALTLSTEDVAVGPLVLSDDPQGW